jgi:hypothetical protein
MRGRRCAAAAAAAAPPPPSPSPGWGGGPNYVKTTEIITRAHSFNFIKTFYK